jgi:hypothetical protein
MSKFESISNTNSRVHNRAQSSYFIGIILFTTTYHSDELNENLRSQAKRSKDTNNQRCGLHYFNASLHVFILDLKLGLLESKPSESCRRNSVHKGCQLLINLLKLPAGCHPTVLRESAYFHILVLTKHAKQGVPRGVF